MSELNYDRTKKKSTIKEENAREAKSIFDDFRHYATGFRVLFLIHRNKEGGATNNTKVKKVITSSEKEFEEELGILIEEMSNSPLPLRIYSTVNERDIDKAIRYFKFAQLEADYYDRDSMIGFYTDVRNRMISALMVPSSRKKDNHYFILDIDGDQKAVGEVLQQIPEDVTIFKQYATKNGWHIITSPFNPSLISHPALEIHKDGMILLKYAKEKEL